MNRKNAILFGLRNIVCGVLLFLFSAALVAELISILRDAHVIRLDSGMLFTLAAAIYSLVHIVGFTSWFKHQNREIPEYVWTKNLATVNLLKVPTISFFLLFLSSLLTQLLHFLAKFSPLFKNALQDYNDLVLQQLNPLHPLTILAIVILVPLAEELMFRAFLIGELKRFLPVNIACLLSAVAFAIAHWNLLQSAYTLVAGLVLAFAYVWTESIYFTIALHACFNLCGSVIPYVLLRYSAFEIPYALLMLALAIIGYFAFGSLYKHSKQKLTEKNCQQ